MAKKLNKKDSKPKPKSAENPKKKQGWMEKEVKKVIKKHIGIGDIEKVFKAVKKGDIKNMKSTGDVEALMSKEFLDVYKIESKLDAKDLSSKGKVNDIKVKEDKVAVFSDECKSTVPDLQRNYILLGNISGISDAEESAANIESLLQDLNNWNYQQESYSRNHGDKPISKEEFSKHLSDKYEVKLKIK